MQSSTILTFALGHPSAGQVLLLFVERMLCLRD